MTAPNFDVTAHELGIARREILKVRAERDALQARVEELEAALAPLARTRYCTNAESDLARAVLRSDRREQTDG